MNATNGYMFNTINIDNEYFMNISSITQTSAATGNITKTITNENALTNILKRMSMSFQLSTIPEIAFAVGSSTNNNNSSSSGTGGGNTNVVIAHDDVNDDVNENFFNIINYHNETELHDKICLTWKKLTLVILFCTLIIITIIGNTLVILSVLTTRRLRTVTNCFVMSLAVADWLVGIFVMPPAVMLFIVDSWTLGWILCDIWISLDVLLCTASILSLCAISVDRYLAVTQPLNYSKRRRSKRLALIMIFIVWLVALAITCPPILGWYDPERQKNNMTDCHYNQNKLYVVYSALGSFFIPMAIMLYVYLKIFYVLTSRQHRMTKTEACEKNYDTEGENLEISEVETNPSHSPHKGYIIKGTLINSTNNHLSSTTYDLLNTSKSNSSRNMKSHNHKYLTTTLSNTPTATGTTTTGGSHHMKPLTMVQFTQSEMSISESCCSTSNNNRFRIQGNRVPMRISSLKRETKTAQTLSMVVGGFIACWLPFFIYYILMPFLPKKFINNDLMEFLTWLGWMNSGINPFIYAFYNVDFRIAFWRLTLRKFYKNKHNLSFLKT